MHVHTPIVNANMPMPVKAFLTRYGRRARMSEALARLRES